MTLESNTLIFATALLLALAINHYLGEPPVRWPRRIGYSADVRAWLAESLHMLNEWKVRQITRLQNLGWHCLSSDTTSFGLPGHVRVSVQPPQAQDALQVALHAINNLCSEAARGGSALASPSSIMLKDH